MLVNGSLIFNSAGLIAESDEIPLFICKLQQNSMLSTQHKRVQQRAGLLLWFTVAHSWEAGEMTCSEKLQCQAGQPCKSS